MTLFSAIDGAVDTFDLRLNVDSDGDDDDDDTDDTDDADADDVDDGFGGCLVELCEPLVEVEFAWADGACAVDECECE